LGSKKFEWRERHVRLALSFRYFLVVRETAFNSNPFFADVIGFEDFVV
jgi:hypothetical protein